MANFEIGGKEYELKLTYKGAKHLTAVGGNALEVVGKAMQGDMELFPHVVHACLIGQGEKYTYADVEQAIEEALENERLDLLGIMRISNEVVTESFFYKALVDKMMAGNKDAKKELDKLLK